MQISKSHNPWCQPQGLQPGPWAEDQPCRDAGHTWTKACVRMSHVDRTSLRVSSGWGHSLTNHPPQHVTM